MRPRWDEGIRLRWDEEEEALARWLNVQEPHYVVDYLIQSTASARVASRGLGDQNHSP
jgi:hypothetical protein